jgi:aspartyl-tRNA(Asn)/glutamyl-tRNA(Gln) amidotransferase subunit A
MSSVPSTIRGLRTALAEGRATPSRLARAALDRSNRNAGRNTYLWQDAAWTLAEAARAEAMPRGAGGPFGDGRGALWGLPVSVKDCFDLAGAPTSCGVHLYRDLNGAVERDSWLVERLRAAGAVITGKTHLHPLAYGITGENAEFGDCVQPRDAGALTGGSSSGAVASVQEGSAVIAIGTDTGGAGRAGRLSSLAGPWGLARWRAPGGVVRHHGMPLQRACGRAAAGGLVCGRAGGADAGVQPIRGGGGHFFSRLRA